MRRVNRKTEKQSKLLDRLQEDSWQLELIVSGAVIFLLLGGYEPFVEIYDDFGMASLGGSVPVAITIVFLSFLRLSYLLLIGMFLIHLSIRGIWIGAIGLRSVSGDFDYDALDYQPKFSRFLRRRLGNFDDYIEKLEKNASVAFSLTFLLFFAILSVGLFFVALMVGLFLFTGPDGQINNEDYDYSPWWFYTMVTLTIVWVLFMVLTGFLYFIDFITFGWLKRRRWFQRVYFPFYRFLGWVTFARLYRPIYYNIIDNRFGKRLVGVYLLSALLITIGSSLEMTPFPYFSYAIRKAGVVHPGDYLDSENVNRVANNNDKYPSLGSRFATADYLEVFLPSRSNHYKSVLEKRFPELKPLVSNSVTFGGKDGLQDTPAARIDSTLRALTAVHRLYLNDSLLTDLRWKYYEHPIRKQPGLLCDLPVYGLPRGEYLLRFEGQSIEDDSLYWQEISTISFMR